MSAENPLPNRLKAATPGLGEPDTAAIETRAMELAKIDGRDFFTDADLSQAAGELAGIAEPPEPPEVSDAPVEDVTTWDEPTEQDGHRVDRGPLDDENSVAEQLVEDGIEEAEHDLRVTAEDENDDVLPGG